MTPQEQQQYISTVLEEFDPVVVAGLRVLAAEVGSLTPAETDRVVATASAILDPNPALVVPTLPPSGAELREDLPVVLTREEIAAGAALAERWRRQDRSK
jgi:hypothetical protein